MKLISFAVPCYNSAAYMKTCINSLLKAGDDIEILIVDDGSAKDNTLEIAKSFEAKYPGICRAIHQENAGHGGAVNTGLRNAEGMYFKVVDSDDKLDAARLPEVMKKLRELAADPDPVDMFVCNFVYDKQGQKRKKIMSYRSAFPTERVFGWDEVKRFKVGQYILMHSVIYRTQVLKDCGLVLPEKTFYVDNIYVYYPLPYVKKMYYMDTVLYRYFIGREDQSVNEKIMIGRIDQQLRVTKTMLGYYDLDTLEPDKLRRYMFNYLDIMMTIPSILAIRSESEENMQKKAELWDTLKADKPELWKKLRHTLLGTIVNMHTALGLKAASDAYRIAQKLYGFN